LAAAAFQPASQNFTLPARRSAIHVAFFAYTSVPAIPAKSTPRLSCTPPVTKGWMPLAFSFSAAASSSA
jgi:hypothetical protein